MRKIAIGLFVLCLMLMMNSVTAASWNSDWNYYKPITINHTYASDEQTNFPMLIDITDSDLALKAQADGDDIVFVNSDNTIQLDHQIEGTFNSTNGHLKAWIRIPTLSNTTDTVINMYYNNSGATNTENPAGVWGVNASGIWLMDEGTGTVVIDSSGNGNDGVNNGADWVTGGLDFNGTSDYMNASGFSPDMVTTKAYTIAYRLNTTQSITSGFEACHVVLHDGSDGFGVAPDTSGNIFVYTTGGNTATEAGAGTPVNDGQLHAIVAVFDQVNDTVSVYVDGILDYQVASYTDNSNTINANLSVGCNNVQSGGYYDGIFEDIQIYDRVLSAEEVGTRYNNTNSPSTFSSVGAEQTPDTTDPVVNTVTLNNTAPNTGDAILVTVDATDNAAVISVKANNVALVPQGGDIWKGTITALVGTHIVNVSATDAVDNVGWNNSTSYTTTTTTDLYNITFLPPITTMDQFNLKDGRTLPIKFASQDNDTGDFIYDDTVNVTITDSTGHLITYFTYGTGSESVRINTREEQYIVNFHTRNYALNVGETYVITVTFGEPGSLRGYEITDFTLVYKGKGK